MNRNIFAEFSAHSEFNEAFFRLRNDDLVLVGDGGIDDLLLERNFHRTMCQVREKLRWWRYPSKEAIALSRWIDVVFLPNVQTCGCCGQLLMFDNGPQQQRHRVGFDTLGRALDISEKIKNKKRRWCWFLALASCVFGCVLTYFLWRWTFPVAAEPPSVVPVSITPTPKASSKPLPVPIEHYRRTDHVTAEQRIHSIVGDKDQSIPTPKASSKPLPVPNENYRHLGYVTAEQRIQTIFGDRELVLHWKKVPLTIILALIVGLIYKTGLQTVHQKTQPSARNRQRLDSNHRDQQRRRQQQNSTRARRRPSVARQHQRASRRGNRSRQVFGRTNVHISVPNDEDPNEAMPLSDALILCSGRDLLHTQVAINAKESMDSCPICLATFSDKDLMDTYCIVLSCKHACCVPCLKAIEDSGRPPDCPCCREPHRIGLERLKDILWPVVADRMQLLPGLSLEDKRTILDLLLKHHKYRISMVDQALEDMLLGSIAPARLQWPEWTPEQKEWTSEEKAVIFDQAQRPVNNIRQQINRAEKELRKANGAEMYNEKKEASREFAETITHSNSKRPG